MAAACCPDDSWPALTDTPYECQGVVDTLDESSGFKVYKVGAPNSKCIIWNYDIYGFEGGRTRKMADFVASQGYMVLIPDYFRGEYCKGLLWLIWYGKSFCKSQTVLSKISKDYEDFILPYAKNNGAQEIGLIGFCWGSAPVLHLSSLEQVKCGVSMHPSHPRIFGMTGDSELEVLKGIRCPQLIMPASNDPASVKEGGLAQKTLGTGKCQIIEFPDMKHGWSVRGDCSKPLVERDVKKAFNAAVEFFNKHLKS